MKEVKKLIFKDTPYILKQTNFSTIEFVFIFPCNYDKNNIFYLPLLRQLLLNTSAKYKTENEYKKAYNENMIINQSLKIVNYNENTFLEFGLVVPDPKRVKNYDLENAFKFFIDTIYNPNVEQDEFNNNCFNREKEYLKNDILSSIKNVNEQSYQSFLNIVDDKGILKNNIYNNMDLIDKANKGELYNIYNKYIKNNKPIIIVYGNVDKKINNMISKYINIENKEIIVNKNYSNYLIPFKKKKEVEEISKYNQSIIYIAYKIKNMTEEDEIYLSIIKSILGTGTNELIFKKLRNELGLIYSSNTWCNSKVGLLVIEAYINNNSKDKVLKGVKDVINSLKDKTKLNEYLNILIEDIKFSLIRTQDSRVKPLNDFITKKAEFGYTMEEKIDMYKNINIDKIIKFLDRLKLDTIYFLRGEFNEKQ